MKTLSFNQPELKFNEALHQYSVGEKKLIGVTDLLKSLNIIDDRWFTVTGSQKGKEIHEITELLDRGELNWESLSEEQIHHVKSWADFKEKHDVRIQLIEQTIYHPFYFYAGTIDRLAYVDGELAIIDIKTGQELKWHILQLQLYALIVNLLLHEKVYLYDVYTKTNKYVKYEPDVEYRTVMAILRVWSWKNGN